MHDFRSGIFRPVVSEIVALEMEDAPPWYRKRMRIYFGWTLTCWR
jgi:hypothetical protein